MRHWTRCCYRYIITIAINNSSRTGACDKNIPTSGWQRRMRKEHHLRPLPVGSDSAALVVMATVITAHGRNDKAHWITFGDK